MRLNEKQAGKILQAKTKKDEILLFREYRVKIEEMGFDVMDVRNKQPFREEVFDWGIVKRK
jgi:hypothetical protein